MGPFGLCEAGLWWGVQAELSIILIEIKKAMMNIYILVASIRYIPLELYSRHLASRCDLKRHIALTRI